MNKTALSNVRYQIWSFQKWIQTWCIDKCVFLNLFCLLVSNMSFAHLNLTLWTHPHYYYYIFLSFFLWVGRLIIRPTLLAPNSNVCSARTATGDVSLNYRQLIGSVHLRCNKCLFAVTRYFIVLSYSVGCESYRRLWNWTNRKHRQKIEAVP